MEPKHLSAFPVRSSDWAFWLESIALDSDQHANLIQVDDKVQYLDEETQDQRYGEGYCVHRLSMDKIIEITEKLWTNPGVNQAQKQQMLEGLRFIHERRKEKFHRLFWVVRIFAKFRGIAGQLNAEVQAIDRLQANMYVVPAIPRNIRIVGADKKISSHLKFIHERLAVLANDKNKLLDGDKEHWYEKFFQMEKEIHDYRKDLSDKHKEKFQVQLGDLDKKLNDLNARIPRLNDIVEVFGERRIKANLRGTIASLCAEEGLDQMELKHDQDLFQCTKLEAEALYIKRLVKQKRTNLSLSLLTAIERTWKECIESGLQEAQTKTLEGRRVIFIPQDSEIYLKDSFIAKGSYKATFVITAIHTLESVRDLGNLVILQPINAVIDEIEEEDSSEAESVSDSEEESDFELQSLSEGDEEGKSESWSSGDGSKSSCERRQHHHCLSKN